MIRSAPPKRTSPGAWLRLHRCERGTSLTEFAIVLPVFLIIFFGIMRMTETGHGAFLKLIDDAPVVWKQAVVYSDEDSAMVSSYQRILMDSDSKVSTANYGGAQTPATYASLGALGINSPIARRLLDDSFSADVDGDPSIVSPIYQPLIDGRTGSFARVAAGYRYGAMETTSPYLELSIARSPYPYTNQLTASAFVHHQASKYSDFTDILPFVLWESDFGEGINYDFQRDEAERLFEEYEQWRTHDRLYQCFYPCTIAGSGEHYCASSGHGGFTSQYKCCQDHCQWGPTGDSHLGWNYLETGLAFLQCLASHGYEYRDTPGGAAAACEYFLRP